MTTVVVTGAASGMGRACVDALWGLSDVLVAVDLREPDIDGALCLACDVSDRTAIGALVSRVGEFGPLRALAHAAGISPTMGDPRRIFEVNLVGTQPLLDAFEELVAPDSAAVCFASTAAYQFRPFLASEQLDLISKPGDPGFLDRVSKEVTDSGIAYGLSKVGVIEAVGRAAVRWGRKGGRVNSVSPSLIDTPMGRQEYEQQPMMAQMLAVTPLGRLGQADEIASVAAFLLSDSASFVTGIDLLVDGGGQQGMASAGTPA